jgi:N-acetylmuramoyl-L-alanine amidase
MSIRPQPIALVGALVMAIITGSLVTPHATANDRVVVVQPGQTLSQIAAEQGVSLARLVTLNDIDDPNRIFAGQRIIVRPGPGGATSRSATRGTAPVTHLVAYGETLTGIAGRYGTTVDALARRNRLADASRIYVGQLLRIADGTSQARRSNSEAKSPRRAGVRTHVVQWGETLTGIAIRYRTSVEAIASANQLANASYIRTGQALRIVLPRRSAANRPDRARAGARMPSSMAMLVARRDGMRRMIAQEARRQGVPPSLALAVAWQESGWQRGVVSSAGAIGVMQLLPATGDWVAATMLGGRVDLWDARSNVRAGVRLLKHYLARYGNRPLALAAYYQGQAGTDRHGVYPVSRSYIASILLLQQMFGG